MTGTATSVPPSPDVDEPGTAAAVPGSDGDVAAERDEHLATLQRLQAEYANYRRRTRRELDEQLDRGAQQLVERLLPVLDAADRALEQAPDAVAPLHRVLVETLGAEGLERIEPTGAAFDPVEQHAVEHLPADPDDAGRDEQAPDGAATPVVVDVLRPGYRWRGRLVRPAMVRVQDPRGQEV